MLIFLKCIFKSQKIFIVIINQLSQLFIYFLKKERHIMIYHANLNPIVENIQDELTQKIPLENIELQYKYAYLKDAPNDYSFKAMLKSSQTKPILINSLKNAKQYKINAKCQDYLFDNSLRNLKRVNQIKKGKIQEYYQLCIAVNNIKYIYDSLEKQWKIVQKYKLFQRQYNVISKSKLFRLDMSQKAIQKQDITKKIKKMLQIVDYRGLLRYKHIFIYPVDEKFSIYTSTIFETDSYDEINDIKKIILIKGDKIQDQIKEKMIAFQKKSNKIKYELELRFTCKGLEYLQKSDDKDCKVLFSQSFNFFRDVTDKPLQSEEEMQKLMQNLSLKQNNQSNQDKEKTEDQSEWYVVKK